MELTAEQKAQLKQQPKTANKPNKPSSKASTLAKPTARPQALATLEAKLSTQKTAIVTTAQEMVSDWQTETRESVRGVVFDGLEEVATDDDFFGLSSLFDGGEDAPQLHSADQHIDVAAVAS